MTALGIEARSASWRERAATFAVFLALGLEVGAWAAAIPGLRAEIGIGAGELSLVLLAASIASVTSTILSGMLTPRIGSGRATALAAACTVLGFALPGLAHTFGQLVACGFGLGLAAGALEVAMNGHASDIERRWGSAIMSSFHAAFSLGGLGGSLLGGLVVAAGFGAQGQLWIPLSLVAVLVAVAAPFLGQGSVGQHGPGLGLGRPTPLMLTLGLVALFCYLLEGAMADWSALFMAGVAGAAPALAPLGYAAFSVTMAVGRLTGDAVVSRLGARPVLIGGGLLSALGVGIAVAVPSPVTAALGFALVGIGAANVVPVVFSAAGRAGVTPPAGIAMVSTFGFAGFLGGPPLIGAIATAAGLRVAIGMLVVVALFCAAAGLILPSEERKPGRRAA